MRCRALRRAHKHLGRRGAVLLIFGVGKVCWGLGWLVAPAEQPVGLDVLTRMCSLQSWAWLWIVCGTVTTAAAFLRIGRDWLGFLAALVPPTVWAVAYMAAAIGGYTRGVFVAVWYLTSHIGVICWAATVPEYSVPRARRGKGA